MGKKTKTLITIRNVHAISHLVCGIGSSRESRGKCGRWLGLELLSPQAAGKRGSGLAQEAGWSEGWWASHRVPIYCGLGKLPHSLMPDACSSCAGCPRAWIWIRSGKGAPGLLNLDLVCSGAGKKIHGRQTQLVCFSRCAPSLTMGHRCLSVSKRSQ